MGALQHVKISRVPFPICRSGAIDRAILSNPDGHLSPWQEAVGHGKGAGSSRTHKNGGAYQAIFMMRFQDIDFDWPQPGDASDQEDERRRTTMRDLSAACEQK